MTKRRIAIYLSLIGILLVIVTSWYTLAFLNQPKLAPAKFDGQRALSDVETQVAFGHRFAS